LAGKIQAVRGMNDILTDSTPLWQYIEKTICNILERYAYLEIRFPVLEKTELFIHSIGETSDIVSKEMYTFTDRNGDSLTLRPEGTASCVRAGLQHSLFQDTQRLWYMGPMFRRERPQKGRLRQFHQIGVEAFGLQGPDIDAEIIMMSARIWKELGLEDISLQINSLGTSQSRQSYRDVLIEYFSDCYGALDEDSRSRLDRNPLRILDSKNPEMQSVIRSAPDMDSCLDTESREHFEGLKELLADENIRFEVNPRLVRGLDYYSKTVFEWITDRLGAQGTVCAGGRYDGMVEHFGGRATAGVGFALGLERIIELAGESVNAGQAPHVYFIVSGDLAISAGLKITEQIRDNCPDIRVLMHCGGGSFKSQFRKADKSGAEYALILGEEELTRKTIGIKALRQDIEQTELSWDEIAATLKAKLAV